QFFFGPIAPATTIRELQAAKRILGNDPNIGGRVEWSADSRLKSLAGVIRAHPSLTHDEVEKVGGLCFVDAKRSELLPEQAPKAASFLQSNRGELPHVMCGVPLEHVAHGADDPLGPHELFRNLFSDLSQQARLGVVRSLHWPGHKFSVRVVHWFVLL